MRMVYRGRVLVMCGAVCALLAAAPAMAAFNAYMTIKGVKQGAIKGDAANGNAASGNIQLISVVRDTATGMSTGRRAHATITVTKKLDKASPALNMAASSGEILSEVTIVFEGGAGDAKTAQRIVLTNAVISGIHRMGENEQITFEYQTIQVTYAKGGKTATDDWTAPTN